LGVAILDGTRLSALADIPDDWDIGSALLRTAVQSECHREIISDPAVRDGALSSLLDSGTAALFSQKRLQQFRPARGNFMERLMVWPLTRRLLPRLWKLPGSKRSLGIFGSVAAILASASAVFEYSILALIFLFLGGLGGKLRNRISLFSKEDQEFDIWKSLFGFFAILTLLILVFRQSTGAIFVPNLVITGLLLSNLTLVRWIKARGKIAWFEPDDLLIILILLVATIFGGFTLGLYGAALYCAAFLVLHFVNAANDVKSDGKPAK